MDPYKFLRSRDETERALMMAIVAAAAKIEEEVDLARAKMIANAVWEAVN